jgi:hypothetical protein
MNRMLKTLGSILLLATAAGCVVVPAHRGYWGGPRVAVVAPAPVVVLRPYRYGW